MDLRIGVLSHTVMQHKFKERKHRDDKGLLERKLKLYQAEDIKSIFLAGDELID